MVTGGAGFIGSHIVDRLLNKDYRVIVLDNFDDYYTRKLQNLQIHLSNPNFKLVKGNILDLPLLKKLMKNIDVVFHEAAQPGVRISVKDPMKSYKVNVEGTLNVLIAARDKNVDKVINASSSSIYGVPKKFPASENELSRPISPYGISKLIAENYCTSFFKLYGLKTLSLRYFTVYGERQRPDMAIRIFVDSFLQGKNPIVLGGGTQTRDFTYISDVVDANLMALKSNAFGKVLNIGSGKKTSINDLVTTIARIMKVQNYSIIYKEKQLGDAPHTLSDISLAKKLLNWQPKVSLEEGLKKFVTWYIARADQLRETKSLRIESNSSHLSKFRL